MITIVKNPNRGDIDYDVISASSLHEFASNEEYFTIDSYPAFCNWKIANEIEGMFLRYDDYKAAYDAFKAGTSPVESAPSAPTAPATTEIPKSLYDRLRYLGIIDESGVRSHNVGKSDYSKGEHLIQAWTLWLDYPELTSFDHDILKRILRNKEGDTRRMDYEKIIHISEERIRQIDNEPDGNA